MYIKQQHVILYSNGCPKCKILESKLRTAGIEYEVISDVSTMIRKGMMSAPNLEVEGKIMGFMDANNWIGERG